MPKGRTCMPLDPVERENYIAQVKETFLKAYEDKRTVKAAARAAKMDVTTFYRWRHEDKEFDAQWNAVTEVVKATRAEEYREEARRRGVEGVLEPVVSAGRIVKKDDGSILKVRRYSDPLLAKLLSAHCPEFHERLHLTAQTGAPSELDLSQLSTEELQQLKILQEKARVKKPEGLPQNGARHG